MVDAGLATEANLQWLKDHRYGYIVVSRKKKTEMPQGLPMVTVRQDNQRLIRTVLMNNQDTQEIELYCHSTAKEAKEEGIKNRFEKRFEEEFKKRKKAAKAVFIASVPTNWISKSKSYLTSSAL